MTQQQTRRRFLAAAGSIAVASTVPTAASAQSTSSGTQGILADRMGGDVEPDYWAFAKGISSGYGLAGAPADVETLTDRMRNEFNANADLWVEYGNWLLSEADITAYGSAEIGVTVAITRTRWPTRDESEATTIDAAYDDSAEQFTDLEWRLGEPDDPDFEVEVRNKAAERGADELQEFRRRWMDVDDGDHEVPDSEYVSTLAGRYSGSLGFGEDSRHVLELLLGEVDI